MSKIPHGRADLSAGIPARDTATDEYGRPYAAGFRPAVLEWDGWTCLDCNACNSGSACADCQACTDFAAPYPPHWARPWVEGEPERGVEAFGGPGGMSAGRGLVDGAGDWVLIESNRDAAATARAAGHWVVEADIRTLDPRHPVLRSVHRFHGSPPCQTLSSAGKRAGWDAEEIGELQSILWQASEAFGFLEVDDLCSLYGGPHSYFGDVLDGMEDHPDADGWGEFCGGGHLPPCMTPAEFREWAASSVSDERTALMAEMLIWPMCLVRIGAPLRSITMEQSANLLRQTPALAEAIQAELTSAEGLGWTWCSWQIEDAADYDAATHRERAWMVATRYEHPRYADHVDGEAAAREMWAHILKQTGCLPEWAPELSRRIEPYQGRPALPTVTVAAALNLPSDWWADTRGKRGVNPRTGKPMGGGSFPLNTVGQCVTAPWYGIRFRPADVPQGEGTVKISLPELGMLVGFRRDYPWTYIPTRKGAAGIRNIAQMEADAVSPFMGAAISAAVQGEDWYQPTSDYQRALYGLGTPNLEPGPHRAAIQPPHTGARPLEQLEFAGPRAAGAVVAAVKEQAHTQQMLFSW
ncbi:DNA cytosine methyltransferase [Kitasatospora sp. NPDC048296]|uniref:DNA cytosine methyltransferase n=1 Tax=Kitasatospora sp. NPDC048296 TaxID=3364048 RepID=UPI00371C9CC0